MTTSLQSVEDVMSRLAKIRPIYHSEADFQHAFAWELHKRKPNGNISLERPFKTDSANLHLDLLFQSDGASLVVELKYKTLRLEHGANEHGYRLLNQGAQDIGRYDFIKDIWRLEVITRSIPQSTGWAILLTNDSTYWNPAKRQDTADSSFRLSDGTTLQGSLSWGPKTSAGTMKNREKSLVICKAYKLRWCDYSTIAPGKNGRFRYLAVRVGSDSPNC